MDVYCTNPRCPNPKNSFPEFSNPTTLVITTQKECPVCRMPLILGGRYIAQQLLETKVGGRRFKGIDRHTPTQRPCLIQQFVVSPQVRETELPEIQARFTEEIATLDEVGRAHPQIPRTYAYFPMWAEAEFSKPGEQHFFYFVQEYFAGHTLAAVLEEQGALEAKAVETILTSVLQVLDYCHNRNCIHQAITPTNLVYDSEGHICLTNFAVIRQALHNTGLMAQSGVNSYTPGYVPAEQMLGGEVFPATDLYSLAVTCLVLLTKQEPQTLYDAFHSRWNYQDFLKPHNIAVPDHLTKILDRMLVARASDRFPSASAVLEALSNPASLQEPQGPKFQDQAAQDAKTSPEQQRSRDHSTSSLSQHLETQASLIDAIESSLTDCLASYDLQVSAYLEGDYLYLLLESSQAALPSQNQILNLVDQQVNSWQLEDVRYLDVAAQQFAADTPVWVKNFRIGTYATSSNPDLIRVSPRPRSKTQVSPSLASAAAQPAIPDAFAQTSTTLSPSSSTPLPQQRSSAPAKQAIRSTTKPQPSATPRFKLWEILTGAAFTGAEGTLLAILVVSLLGTTLLSTSFWVLLLLGLVGVQYQRWVEGKDLPIFLVLTFGLLLLFPGLRQAVTGSVLTMVTITLFVALGAVAITAFFQLVYRALQRFLP